jgi:hypothetical protein
VIADAEVELGRYKAAPLALQKWVDLKPELSSYARVSYFRELHGSLQVRWRRWGWRSRPAAELEPRLRADAGRPSNSRQNYAAAERAYRAALAGDPAIGGFRRAGRCRARAVGTRGDRPYERAVQKSRCPSA